MAHQIRDIFGMESELNDKREQIEGNVKVKNGSPSSKKKGNGKL